MSYSEMDSDRWTSKRKAAVVLEVLKGLTTSVEACRKYGMRQVDLQSWTVRFLDAAERGLRGFPGQENMELEARIKHLQRRVAELVIERDDLRRRMRGIAGIDEAPAVATEESEGSD